MGQARNQIDGMMKALITNDSAPQADQRGEKMSTNETCMQCSRGNNIKIARAGKLHTGQDSSGDEQQD